MASSTNGNAEIAANVYEINGRKIDLSKLKIPVVKTVFEDEWHIHLKRDLEDFLWIHSI